MPSRQVSWPWFGLGCLLTVAALIAFFWGFAIGDLTPSRRFLLMWLLPLTSGFACGCFVGSLKVSGPIGSLTAAATGGFAVWLLSNLLLPDIPPPLTPTGSREELVKILEERHASIRKKLEEQAPKASDPKRFAEFRNAIETKLAAIQDAYSHREDIRGRDLTKELILFLDSEEAKKLLAPSDVKEIQQYCLDPDIPKPHETV